MLQNTAVLRKEKRIFIFACRADTEYALNMKTVSDEEIIGTQGFMAKAFPVKSASAVSMTTLNDDILNNHIKIFTPSRTKRNERVFLTCI